MYRKILFIFIFIILTTSFALAISSDDKVVLAQVQTEKTLKAKFGNNAKIHWRYVNGKPDCWIEGNSVVVYGTVNGKNFSSDVIVDEINNKLYVKSFNF